MKKTRLIQKEVFYPFFKEMGRNVAIFYTFTLFEDGSEELEIPALCSSSNDRMAANRMMMNWAADKLGKSNDISVAAHSSAWVGELRASIGL